MARIFVIELSSENNNDKFNWEDVCKTLQGYECSTECEALHFNAHLIKEVPADYSVHIVQEIA